MSSWVAIENQDTSDLTDAEWAVLEPLLPALSAVGRPPAWPMRAIVNAIYYVLCREIPWRMLPPCFPPRQTVYGGSPPGGMPGRGRRSIIGWSCWIASASAARVVQASP
jgi:transposase